MRTADARGIPAVTFSGKLEIHFTPSTRADPAMDAGSAMIREDGRSGKRRKNDGGFTVCPALCIRYVASTSSTTCVSRPRSMLSTWLPGITANGGTEAGPDMGDGSAVGIVLVTGPSLLRSVGSPRAGGGPPWR